MNGWIRRISPAGKAIMTIALTLAVLIVFAAPAMSGHGGGHGGGHGFGHYGHGGYVHPAGRYHGHHQGYYGWGGYYRPHGYYYPAAVYAPAPVVYAAPPVVYAPPPPAGINFVFPIRIH